MEGGDYNAKHTNWGSRLISFKEHELHKRMESNYLKHLSMAEPTYCPSDRNKLPDLVEYSPLNQDTEAAAKFFSDTIQCTCWNAMLEHKRPLKAYDCTILNNQKLKKKEDSVEGTIYEHPQARDYFMQHQRNSKNSIITKTLHSNIPARTYTYRIH
jgi:hypothetical protein